VGEAPRGGSAAQGIHVVAPPPETRSHSPEPTASGRSAGQQAQPVSFTGALVQTPYGDVQVRAVVQGRRLVDVVPLHLTDSSGRSVSISAQAAPILRREALAAGTAHIDTVSGASYTSQGYIESLQSALDAARAAA
jgi:uncharacterized protein with FMN-binding domain